jgi:hypothetical protein
VTSARARAASRCVLEGPTELEIVVRAPGVEAFVVTLEEPARVTLSPTGSHVEALTGDFVQVSGEALDVPGSTSRELSLDDGHLAMAPHTALDQIRMGMDGQPRADVILDSKPPGAGIKVLGAELPCNGLSLNPGFPTMRSPQAGADLGRVVPTAWPFVLSTAPGGGKAMAVLPAADDEPADAASFDELDERDGFIEVVFFAEGNMLDGWGLATQFHAPASAPVAAAPPQASSSAPSVGGPSVGGPTGGGAIQRVSSGGTTHCHYAHLAAGTAIAATAGGSTWAATTVPLSVEVADPVAGPGGPWLPLVEVPGLRVDHRTRGFRPTPSPWTTWTASDPLA